MAKGDEVGKAFQRIVSADPVAFEKLQSQFRALAAVMESPEYVAVQQEMRRDWMAVTGLEYPETWEEIQRQAILVDIDRNRFLDGWAGLKNETLNTLLPIIEAGLERLQLLRTAEFTPEDRSPQQWRVILRHINKNALISEPSWWRWIRPQKGAPPKLRVIVISEKRVRVHLDHFPKELSSEKLRTDDFEKNKHILKS